MYCAYDDSLIWNWTETDEKLAASTAHTCGFSTQTPLLWIDRLSASENCSASVEPACSCTPACGMPHVTKPSEPMPVTCSCWTLDTDANWLVSTPCVAY